MKNKRPVATSPPPAAPPEPVSVFTRIYHRNPVYRDTISIVAHEIYYRTQEPPVTSYHPDQQLHIQ